MPFWVDVNPPLMSDQLTMSRISVTARRGWAGRQRQRRSATGSSWTASEIPLCDSTRIRRRARQPASVAMVTIPRQSRGLYRRWPLKGALSRRKKKELSPARCAALLCAVHRLEPTARTPCVQGNAAKSRPPKTMTPINARSRSPTSVPVDMHLNRRMVKVLSLKDRLRFKCIKIVALKSWNLISTTDSTSE